MRQVLAGSATRRRLTSLVGAAVVVAGCGRSAAPAARRGDASATAPPGLDAAATAPAAVSPPVDTATGASPAWTAGPPVVVGESVDGAALRAANRARLAADHSPVTVLTGKSALELGQRLCEAVVPRRPPATPVLLKPNLGGFDWFKDPKTHGGDNGVTGRTTDPEFVRGVIRCLKQRGHTKITVADGFGGKPTDWDRLIKVSGYARMAKEEHVALVALDDDGVYDVEGDQPGKPLGIRGMDKTRVPTLLMPKIVAEHLDHGLYLSLPKIKAHRFAVFSIGIKAQQGVAMYADAAPAYHQKWRTHREIGPALALVKKNDPRARAAYVDSLEKFAERMVDILEVDAPHAVLAEGAPAMSGDGFQVLYPSKELVAIGGTNVVLVDRVGAAFLGLWDSAGLARELGGHRTSPLLEVAAARFGLDLTAMPALTGDGAPLLAARRPARFIGMAGFTVDDSPPPALAELHAARVADDHAPALGGATGATIGGTPAPVWDQATPLTFATDFAGATTPTATTVRALWSSAALYLRWDLAGAGLATDTTRPIAVERDRLYQEDCVELFLAPDPARPRRYAEIEVGPFGHFFDLAIDRSGARTAWTSDAAWSAGLVIATWRDPETRTAAIEVAITAPELIAALTAGARLPLGLDRMEGKAPRRYLMAFPGRTAKPNFHAPTGFGTLVLEP